jgi:hypothetical protein
MAMSGGVAAGDKDRAGHRDRVSLPRPDLDGGLRFRSGSNLAVSTTPCSGDCLPLSAH